jgi:hypothetical protein
LHSDEHPIAGRVTSLVAKKAVALATWIEEAINKTRACKLSRLTVSESQATGRYKYLLLYY